MRSKSTLKTIVVFLLLLALHYTVRPLLAWRLGIDFLVIAVLLLSVRLRPGTAALLGFAIGLVSDSLTPTAFGAGALALTGLGFAASWLKAVFFADNVVLHASFFFLGKWAYDVVYVLVARQSSPTAMLGQILLWSPLTAVVTAIAGVAIMMAFRVTLEPQRI